MKLSGWQFVVFGAVLLAAILLSYKFAPDGASTIVGVVTTILGLLAQKSKDDEPSKPNLTIVSSALLLLGLGISACGNGLATYDQLNDPHDDAVLAKCRQEARDARDAGASVDDALRQNKACQKDGGL